MLYYQNGSYALTAKALGITPATVSRVISDSEKDPRMKVLHAQVLEKLAGQSVGVGVRVLESVTDGELKTRYHKTYTKGGEMKIAQEGPSLADKAKLAQVAADSAQKLTAAAMSLRGGGDGNVGLMLPSDLEAARLLLVQKMRRLRITEVEFDDSEAGQLAKNVVDRAERGGVTAEMVENQPLDDPPGPDGAPAFSAQHDPDPLSADSGLPDTIDYLKELGFPRGPGVSDAETDEIAPFDG
jgi:hypothetical protein